MPQVAIAGLVGAAGAVGSAALGAGLGTLTLKTVLGAALVSAGSTALQLALNKPTTPVATLQIKQATPSGQFCFGRARVSGTATFIDNNGKDIWLVLPIACHEIDEVEQVYDGENLFYTNTGIEPDYAGKVAVYIRKGLPGQTSIPDLQNTFGYLNVNFRGRGTAYIALRLIDFQKNWGGRLPQLWARVRGARPIDPRTGLTQWTANWALNVAYFMQHERGGNKQNLNQAALIASANISDEQIPDNGMFSGEEQWAFGNDGTNRTHNRYELNGAFSTKATPKSILSAMMPYGVGDVYESTGQYHINAGAYSAPVATFGKDDFIEVPQVFSEVKIEDEVDGVRARYTNPTANFTPDDAPEIIFNPGDPQRFLDNLDLTAETHPERAQRIMALMGRKTMKRLSMAVVLPITALAVEVGDRVSIDFDEVGVSSDFEVRQKSVLLSPEGSIVSLDLLEDRADFWAFNKDDANAVVASSKSTLASVTSVVAPIGPIVFTEPEPIVATTERFEKFLRLSFTGSSDTYLNYHIVRWTVNGTTQERDIGIATEFDILGLVPGDSVSVEVFAVNSVGISSPVITGTHAFIGRSTMVAQTIISFAGAGSIGTGTVVPNGFDAIGEFALELARITFDAPRSDLFVFYDLNLRGGPDHRTIFALNPAGSFVFSSVAQMDNAVIHTAEAPFQANANAPGPPLTKLSASSGVFRMTGLTVGDTYRLYMINRHEYGLFTSALGNTLSAAPGYSEGGAMTIYEALR